TAASGEHHERAAAAASLLAARARSKGSGSGGTALHDIELVVGAGEIRGIAGVDGNGQDELAAALYGLSPRAGEVRIGGAVVAGGDVAAAQRAGAALIPGDRRRDGLAPRLRIWENALLSRPLLARVAPRGMLDPT